MEDVVLEVEALAAAGYREIVLTGIHLSSYGVDFKKRGTEIGRENGAASEKTGTGNAGEETGAGKESGAEGRGAEKPETPPLLSLIVRLDAVPGIERIRLGSLEPRIITDEFAGTLAGLTSFCPHFHLSLQSVCD